jgi:hypothetical protein
MKNLMAILSLLTTFKLLHCSENQTVADSLSPTSSNVNPTTPPINILVPPLKIEGPFSRELGVWFHLRDVEERLREELKRELPPVESSDDESSLLDSDDDSDHVLGRMSQAEDRNPDEDTKK